MGGGVKEKDELDNAMAYIPPPTSVMGFNPYSDSDKCIKCTLGISLEKEI